MSPRPCQLSRTFNEAKNICAQQGLSLCSNNEVLDSICCKTGCEIDATTMWIADDEQSKMGSEMKTVSIWEEFSKCTILVKPFEMIMFLF